MESSSSPQAQPPSTKLSSSIIAIDDPTAHAHCTPRGFIALPSPFLLQHLEDDVSGVLFQPADIRFQGAFCVMSRTQAGLNEKETESLVTWDPDLRLKSIGSLQSRVASLKAVGISGLELCHLVAKCPSMSAADEIDPSLKFMRDDLDGKVDPMQLKRPFMLTEPRFLVGFEDKVNLLIDGGIRREKIVHVLNNVNLTKALSLKPFEEIERLVNFLSRYGDGVDLIVRHLPILNFHMDGQLIPRVGVSPRT